MVRLGPRKARTLSSQCTVVPQCLAHSRQYLWGKVLNHSLLSKRDLLSYQFLMMIFVAPYKCILCIRTSPVFINYLVCVCTCVCSIGEACWRVRYGRKSARFIISLSQFCGIPRYVTEVTPFILRPIYLVRIVPFLMSPKAAI